MSDIFDDNPGCLNCSQTNNTSCNPVSFICFKRKNFRPEDESRVPQQMTQMPLVDRCVAGLVEVLQMMIHISYINRDGN